MMFWYWYDRVHYVTAVVNWYKLSAKEREIHPVTRQNLWYLAKYAFDTSAIATLIGAPAIALRWARHKFDALFWLGAIGLAADLALLLNHDLAVNPRYLLMGLLGLALVSGWALATMWHERKALALPCLLGLVVLTKGSYNIMAKELYDQNWGANAAKEYYDKQVGTLPWNAGFIVGARTPLINFYAGVGAHPYWNVIPPGSGWPDDKLAHVIEQYLLGGRRMYVDFDPQLWQTGERERNREHAALAQIKQDFELEHIRAEFYRIVQRKLN